MSNNFDTTTLLNTAKALYADSAEINWHGVTMIIKPVISLQEVMEFTDYVTKMSFGDDGEYRPELKDLAIKICVLEKYAGVVFPEDIKDTYDILYKTDIFNVVYSNIDQIQIRELIRAIDLKIANIAEANVERINAQMEEVNKKFVDLQGKMEQIFSGVTSDDIATLLTSIPNIAGINENDFVEKYIETTNKMAARKGE